MPATPRNTCFHILLIAALIWLAVPASAEMVIVSGEAGTLATAVAWNDMGNTYASQYRWDAAIDAYTRAISLETGFARAYFNRGKAYAALKRYDEAIADYEKAIALDPTQRPVVANYLESALSIRYPTIPSGSLVKGSWQPGSQFLAIDNSQGSSDLVVALAPRGSKGALLAVYVAKGYAHRFDQVVPQGPYDIYITFGERWDPRIQSFAKVGGYLKWELPQYFSGLDSQGYTMTFITWQPPSSWWNYSLTPIAQDQFPVL
ncbi:MAG: tetratricopeptide repeat protein [Methanolinea sp.]|nr:tetratricopeptide repeat protein [Methanolinea sp.]